MQPPRCASVQCHLRMPRHFRRSVEAGTPGGSPRDDQPRPVVGPVPDHPARKQPSVGRAARAVTKHRPFEFSVQNRTRQFSVQNRTVRATAPRTWRDWKVVRRSGLVRRRCCPVQQQQNDRQEASGGHQEAEHGLAGGCPIRAASAARGDAERARIVQQSAGPVDRARERVCAAGGGARTTVEIRGRSRPPPSGARS